MSATDRTDVEPNAGPTKFVDLETAKQHPGLRLVTVAHLPSPWSEAAKGIFRIKGLPFVAVRLEPMDKGVREWSRARNAPAVLYGKEPPRTGWGEILELAERLAPRPSLVPGDPAMRSRMYGLSQEVLGEGGLLWSGRLLTVDAGLKTDGERGFPPMVAQYLARRYGYDKADLPRAATRIEECFGLLEEALGSRAYFFGDEPTALDIYSAAALNVFSPLPHEQCPMAPVFRQAFESMRDEIGAVPDALLAHRERMYERHLELPIVV